MMFESDQTNLISDMPSTIISRDDFYQTSLQPRPLRRRWYILLVFFLLANAQGVVRDTWQYILKPDQVIKGMSTSMYILLLSWSPILFILFCFLMAKLVVTYGLRFCTIHCALLLALGTGLRCIPVSDPWPLIAAHLCGILNGYCGTLTMAGATSIAVLWFPLSQRVTATAILVVAGRSVADCIYFLVSRYWISRMYASLLPSTYFVDHTNLSSDPNLTFFTNESFEFLHMMRSDKSVRGLSNFMGVEFLVCILIFASTCLHFPKAPSVPANFTSPAPRPSFSVQLKLLFREKNAWLVVAACALPFGAAQALQHIVPQVMNDFGYQVDVIQWLDFFGHVGALLGCLCMGRVADYLLAQLKTLLTLCMITASLSYLWFAFTCVGIFPNNTTCAYIAFVLGTMAVSCATPLALELICEVAFPVFEFLPSTLFVGVSTAALLLTRNIVRIRTLGLDWILYLVPVLCFLSLLPLYFVVPVYRRLRTDLERPPRPSVSSDGLSGNDDFVAAPQSPVDV